VFSIHTSAAGFVNTLRTASASPKSTEVDAELARRSATFLEQPVACRRSKSCLRHDAGAYIEKVPDQRDRAPYPNLS